MKKSLFSAIFSVFALMTLDATATPIPFINGPVTINWTVNQQKLDNTAEYAGNGKTNFTGSGKSKATNVVQVYKSSFTTNTINNAGILALLENSLKTTFPAGAKLATDGTDLYVVDHTGTNAIADITSIVTVTTSDAVISALDTTTTTLTKSGTTGSAVGTGSGSQAVIVMYDDSALTTADGTTTTFKFVGVSAFTQKGSSTTSTTGFVTGKESGTFTVHGVGYGSIRGQASLIQGTIFGMPSGTYSY